MLWLGKIEGVRSRLLFIIPAMRPSPHENPSLPSTASPPRRLHPRRDHDCRRDHRIARRQAIPAFQRVQRRSQNSRFVSDLRIFSQAFETYSLENDGWPPNVGPGLVPAGLSGALQVSVWTAPTVVGGRWNYDRNINGIAVAVAVSCSGTGIDDARMQEIDAMLDGGDLSTGRFQLIGSR